MGAARDQRQTARSDRASAFLRRPLVLDPRVLPVTAPAGALLCAGPCGAREWARVCAATTAPSLLARRRCSSLERAFRLPGTSPEKERDRLAQTCRTRQERPVLTAMPLGLLQT